MVSSDSPGPTVTAVPPSQVKRGGGGGGGADGGKEPVTSPLLPGWYEPMPRPPPETPSPLTRGSGRLSMRLLGGGAEPTTSPRGRSLSKSEKRLASVQPAAPKPINAIASTCGQTAERPDAHMITRPHATITLSERINPVGVNRHLSPRP